MRAWELTEPAGPRALALVERPDPTPGPTDVVVRIEAISLNYRDLLMVRGRYSRTVRAGMVPCSDAAGVVTATGAGVRHVKVGDRVTSTFAPEWNAGRFSMPAARSALGTGATPGVLADTVVLPDHGVLPPPSHLTQAEAATLPCAALTAWHALMEETPIGPGDVVLTLGSGGVSVFAVQFAVRAGARVIATSGDAAKAERLQALGVDRVVNYREVAAWGEAVRELTGGEGVDHVVEVGGAGTLEQSLKAVRLGGTVSLIGTLAGAAPVNLTPVFMRNIRLQGVLVGSREMFQRMNDDLSDPPMRPVVDRVFPFSDAPSAFEHLEAAKHFGKVVIEL